MARVKGQKGREKVEQMEQKGQVEWVKMVRNMGGRRKYVMDISAGGNTPVGEDKNEGCVEDGC